MSSQVLKFLAVVMLIGSVVLIVVALRLGQTPTPPGGNAVSTAPTPAAPPQHKVVIASRPIRAGETIGAADITLAPAAAPPPGAIENTADAVGKQPLTAIAQGSPVLNSHLPDIGALTQSLREDERAVAVKVDELIGVGGFLRPGDRVDVMVYLRGDNQQVKESQAMIILHSVRVLAYGEELPGKPSETDAKPSSDTPKSAKGRNTAVLAIKAPDVTRLTLAENAGVLRLALRPALADEGETQSPYGVSMKEISAPSVFAAPEDKVQGPRVLIIRGTAVEAVQLP